MAEGEKWILRPFKRGDKPPTLPPATPGVESAPAQRRGWFSQTPAPTAERMVPIEKFELDKMRDEAKHFVQGLVENPDSDTSRQLQAMFESLQTPEGKKRLQKAVEAGMEAREKLKSASPDDRQKYLNEINACTLNEEALANVSETNPLKQILVTRGLIQTEAAREKVGSTIEESRTKGKRTEAVDTSVHKGLSIPIAVVAGLCAVGEAGITKTGTSQGLQYLVLNHVPGAEGVVSSVSSMVEHLGGPAQYGDFVLGSMIAWACASVAVGGKALYKNMSDPQKTFFYTVILYSAVMGYLGLQNSVIDNADIIRIGTQMEKVMSPINQKVAEVKKSLVQIFTDIPTTIKATVDSEVNDPKKPGHGPVANLIESSLNKGGQFDEKAFEAFVLSKGNSKDLRETNTKMQADLAKLKQDYQMSPNEGLEDVIVRLQNQLNLDLAPRLIDSVVKTSQEASKEDIWWSLFNSVNPFHRTRTSASIYSEGERGRDEFKKLLNQYASVQAEVDRITDGYIAGVIKIGSVSKTNSIDAPKMKALAARIKGLFTPLSITPSQLDQALGGVPKPEGKYVWYPGPEEWAKIQSSIDPTFLKKNWGADVVNSKGWAAGLSISLLTVFMFINFGSRGLSAVLDRKRARSFEGQVPKGLERIRDDETNIAMRVGSFISATMDEFNLVDGPRSPLSYPIPSSVVEYYVRQRLREQFIEENMKGGGKDARLDQSRAGRLVHGVIYGHTDADVELLKAYDDWMDNMLKAFQKDPLGQTKKVVSGIFPELDKVLEAHTKYLSGNPITRPPLLDQFRREHQQLRQKQLQAYADAIQAKLQVLGSAEHSLTSDMPENKRKAAPPDIILDPDKEVVVSRDMTLEAFALAQVRSESKALVETLSALKRMGITPQNKVGKESDDLNRNLTIGRFQLGPAHAVEDELKRERMRQATGGEAYTGSAEDYGRFNAYLTEVTKSLKDIQGEIKSRNDILKDRRVEFRYIHSPVAGGYTVALYLYSDDPHKPSIILPYDKVVPPFTDQTPAEVAEDIKRWIGPEGVGLQTLIAQAQYDRLSAEKREKMIDPVPLSIDNSTKSVPAETVEKAEELLGLGELLDAQEPLIEASRRGVRMDESELRLFTNSDEVITRETSQAKLQSIFDSVKKVPVPPGLTASVWYDADRRNIVVETKRISGRIRKTSTPPVRLSLNVKAYNQDALAEIYARGNSV